MKKSIITINPGICVGGFIAGGGYGMVDKITRCADHAAELLVESFGLSVEKRGNSDGKSAGAFHEVRIKGYSASAFGLSAGYDYEPAEEPGKGHRTDKILWYSMFIAKKANTENIKRDVPVRWMYEPAPYNDRGWISVYGPNFDTAVEALDWLKTNGAKYCPQIGSVLTVVAAPRCGSFVLRRLSAKGFRDGGAK